WRLVRRSGAFLERPDQQHQREHLDLVALLRPLHAGLRGVRHHGSCTRTFGVTREVHASHKKESEKEIAQERITEKHPGRRCAKLRETNRQRMNQTGEILGVTRIEKPRGRVRDDVEDKRDGKRRRKKKFPCPEGVSGRGKRD